MNGARPANARARMIAPSRELGEICERLTSQYAIHPEPGQGYVRLAED